MSANLGTLGKLGVDIGFNDKTKPGSQAVERSASKLVQRTSGSALRTLGRVEEAASRAFGSNSLTSGFTRRMSAAKEVASSLGSGLAEASASGNLLSSSLTAIGVVGGATIGVLAAAAYGAFKLADGWAKGAASIGHTADTIGVATKQLQEFTAAAERVGVDRATSTSALASVSQTLNDARYGRNNDAVALLGRLGVKLQLNKDGTVDTGAMIPALADAIARQNSSGRRTAAHILGISDAALPAFAQGGKALSADMSDADKTAYIASDDDIAVGKRLQRKSSIIGQLKDRGFAIAGRASAVAAEPEMDGLIGGGTALAGGGSFGTVVKQTFAPAASMIERGGKAIERAATGLTQTVISAAQSAQRRWGILSSVTLGQYGLESGWGRHMPAGSNNPFGIKARAGQAFVEARTREERKDGSSYYVMQRFRKFDSIEQAFDEHDRLLATGRAYGRARGAANADEFADALTGTYATAHDYGSKLKGVMRDKNLQRFDAIPVKVEVDMRGAPPGTRTKVTAGANKPAVSLAMAH